MTTKKCNRCWKELELTNEFWYSNKWTKDGFYSICKMCKKEALHKYHRTERYRKWNNKRQKKYYEHRANHRREMGYNRIHKRTKKLIDQTIWRPKICTICWEKHTRIIAHHPDYSKWNEIVFCCTLCHYKIHLWEIKNYKIINLLECNRHKECRESYNREVIRG